MKAALYIRVSTQEQIENYSIGSQKERLEAFCKSKGWDIYDTYIDGGYSGATMNRPGLQKLLSELNEIDAVVVYKLDRLSRSQRDTLSLIEEHFLVNQVDFVSITETLDTSTPFGKAMIGILSVFAQLERETIAERMRLGHIKRAEEGYRVSGGDYDPAGYKRKNGELIPVPDEVEHIQQAFDLYEQLHSITKVQEQLKALGKPVWRFRRYRDILSNKLYIGYVSFAGEYYKGRHDPIITEGQFNRVQELLKRHKGSNAHKAKQSLLSGLIVCGNCGEPFVSYSSNPKSQSNKGRKYRYYMCKARRFPSEYPEKCKNKNWNADKLENLIANEIQQLTIGKEITKEKDNKIDYKTIEKRLNNKLSRILGLYAEGKFDKELLDKQVEQINKEKEQLNQKREQTKEKAISVEQLKEYVIVIKNADFNIRQAIVQKLIERIIIHGEDIEIVWGF